MFAVLGVVGMLLLATSGFAQAADLRETLNVTVVEVPVTVVDRSGNPVRGLTKKNFELLDEGKKVDIAYFDVVDTATVHPGQPVNPISRLHVVLLFDLTNSSPGTIERVRQAAHEFVKKGLRPFDLVAVATYSIDHGFRLLTSFTNDRDLLDLAIETLGNPRFFKVGDDLLLSAERPANAPEASAGSKLGSQMDQEFQQQQQEFDRMNMDTHDQYMIGRIRTQLDNLGAFARMLDGIRGRKQIVLLSEGFDPRYVRGKEQTNEQSRETSDAVLSGQIWKVSTNDRYGYTETKTDLDRMARLFRRSDVVLQAIDIKGLRTSVDASTGYKPISNDALFLMTNPTGGEVFKNANDLESSFDKLMKQQEIVYILAFHTRFEGHAGRFHDLKVKLLDVPDARASARAGYYEPSAKTNPIEKTLDTADILLNDIPQPQIPLSTLAVPFPSPGDGDAKVPVIVEIPGRALEKGATGKALSADLFVYAFDKKNSVRDFLHQRITMDREKVATALEKTGIKFYGVLSLPQGEFAIKTLIDVDETHRRGFARDDIRIPGPGRPLLLPPLLFEHEGKWIMVKARPRTSAEVAYPFHVADESFVPAVGVHLNANESYKLALFARGVDYDSTKIRAGLLKADGGTEAAQLTVVGTADDKTDQLNKLVLELGTKGLVPGKYTLNFVLGKKGKEQRASMPFTISPQ